jgi:MOSC domain-containing protein YiiM
MTSGGTNVQGLVETISLASEATATVTAVTEVEAVAGRGLRGDRYESGRGTFSNWPKDHELTLVEAEAVEELERICGRPLLPGETRRNLTTRGVSLNAWVGREFRVGVIRCRGTRLCEPCAHLAEQLTIPDLIRLMAGRGGLRAIILEGGPIRTGDRIGLVKHHI